jgi:hypothetical protein
VRRRISPPAASKQSDTSSAPPSPARRTVGLPASMGPGMGPGSMRPAFVPPNRMPSRGPNPNPYPNQYQGGPR